MIGFQSCRIKAFLKTLDNIHTGELKLIDPDGKERVFGSGEPKVEWTIHDWATIDALMFRGDVGLGESYAEGLWDTPNLEALTKLALLNDDLTKGAFGGPTLQRLAFMFSDKFLRRNSKTGSRKNIHAHYDVGNEFYGRWLDPTMTYSSALFNNPNETLADAQHNKYDRLLKAVENSGPRTLEIGCGWGGFAERAVETSNRDVTALTISQAQHDYATQRLDGRADIRLQDYRDCDGKFDAIVSIEMIEAVGQQYWPTYFKTIKDRLADGGRAAIQAIIVEDHAFDRYAQQTDFIRQYTFPGGMLISPGQIETVAQKTGLVAENFFRFGKDYARTLREWSNSFKSVESEFEDQGFSRPFLRGWKFYLDTCAAAFDIGKRTNIVHVELRHA